MSAGDASLVGLYVVQKCGLFGNRRSTLIGVSERQTMLMKPISTVRQPRNASLILQPAKDVSTF